MSVKTSRRQFVYDSIQLAVAAVALEMSGPLMAMDESNYLELYTQLEKLGFSSFRVSHYPDRKAKSNIAICQINTSYGRLANFSLEDMPDFKEICLITKGPAGQKLKDEYSDLKVIGTYSPQLKNLFYMTDASPHHWNNQHSNNQQVYKSYFIDNLSRAPLTLFVNCYDKDMTLAQQEKLQDVFQKISNRYKTSESRALNSLYLKYQVADFQSFIHGQKLQLGLS